MAGIDILDLTEATEVNETTDYLVIVDKSDTSQDITGSTKKITVKNLLSGLLDLFYPVGTIYETTSSDLDTVEKVNAHFGGTWEFYGAGRVLVAKSSDTVFDTIGETGGVKDVTLTSAQSGVPAHSHPYTTVKSQAMPTNTTDLASGFNTNNAGTGTAYTNNNTASNASQSHTNLQPYIVVYRYRRIS